MFDTLLVVLPLMLSPGPANLVSLVLGARYGVVRLAPFHAGVVLVYAVVAAGIGWFSQRVAEHSPTAIGALQVLGGLFIVYLGVRMAHRSRGAVKEWSPTFASGVTLQCLNPKYPGVVVAVFASQQDQPTAVSATVLCAVGAVGLLTYAIAGALLRQDQADGGTKNLDKVAGALLCCVGAWFIIKAALEY